MVRLSAGLALAGAGAIALAGLDRLRRQRNAQEFDGKVIAITGGSRGLGLAMAEELGKSGARLAICARDEDELAEAKKRLESIGAEVIALPCDVTDEDSVHRFISDVERLFGPINVLINNAGIIMVGPASAFTAEDYRRSMDTLYWGAVYPTLAVAPGMVERGSGNIVNITSVAGYVSVPHLLPYSAGKFALAGFSEGLAAELDGSGVQVTTIVPDIMRTGSYRHARFKGQHQKEYGWFAVGASLPLSSISASHAAKTVVRAFQRGDSVTFVGWKTHIIVRLHGLMPDTFVRALGLANRLLPAPTGPDTPELPGYACESRVTQSFLTALGRRAGRRYNEYNS